MTVMMTKPCLDDTFMGMDEELDIITSSFNVNEVKEWCNTQNIGYAYLGTFYGRVVMRIYHDVDRAFFNLKWA